MKEVVGKRLKSINQSINRLIDILDVVEIYCCACHDLFFILAGRRHCGVCAVQFPCGISSAVHLFQSGRHGAEKPHHRRSGLQRQNFFIPLRSGQLLRSRSDGPFSPPDTNSGMFSVASFRDTTGTCHEFGQYFGSLHCRGRGAEKRAAHFAARRSGLRKAIRVRKFGPALERANVRNQCRKTCYRGHGGGHGVSFTESSWKRSEDFFLPSFSTHR